MDLATRDRAVLDFERSWWTKPGSKEAAIRTELGMSGTRYYELLRRMIDDGHRQRDLAVGIDESQSAITHRFVVRSSRN